MDYLQQLIQQPLLLFDVFRQLPRADFPAVHIALRIHGHTLGCTGSLYFKRVRKAVQPFAIFNATDTYPSLPARMWRHTVGFGVGYINHVVADVDAAWATELLPLAEVVSILIEDLDSHVASVGNKESPSRSHSNALRH